MNLTLLSSTEKKSYSIVWLEVNTPLGNFVVQEGHAPKIVLLADNKPITFLLKNGKQETTTIKNGILEVTRDAATILLIK